MLIELTRSHLAYVVFRKRRLIWLVSAVAMALAIAYCVFATPQYQSKSGLVVNFSQTPSGVPGESAPGAGQSVAPVDHEEIINSYALELRSADLARQVIQEIGVDKLYPPHVSLNPLPFLMSLFDTPDTAGADAALGQDRKVEAAVDRLLRKDLDVQTERNSNVITVTLFNHDRAMAVTTARRLIDRFIEREGRIDRDPRLGFIRDQVEVYRQHVTDAQATMEAFQLKSGISSMEEERTVLIQQRSALEQSISAAQSRAAGDKKSFAALKAQLRQLNPLVAATQNDKDPLELTARATLADLESREAALRQTFSESSPTVQDIHRRVVAAQADLERTRSRSPLTHSEPNVAYQQMQVAMFQTEADLEAARESEASLRQQLVSLNKRLTSRNRQAGAYQDAVRDYQLADQNYRLYLQGVESARIADDLNKQGITSISVFDAPYASTRPARPRRLLALVMGALGGLILGVGLAFMSEALDEGLSTPSQVAAVLKMPVLGSMEKV